MKDPTTRLISEDTLVQEEEQADDRANTFKKL